MRTTPTRHMRLLQSCMVAMQVALENDQPEAAYDIYRKAGMKIEALNTLVERIEDFDRAHEYATKVDDPATWSTLGHAQLARGHVNDAIGSYLLAKDSSKCATSSPASNPESGRSCEATVHVDHAHVVACRLSCLSHQCWACSDTVGGCAHPWSATGTADASHAFEFRLPAAVTGGVVCRYLEVTAMAKETKQYDDLVRFLMMVRDKIKDPKVDTEIAIAYAMTGKLGELEAFITSAPLLLTPDRFHTPLAAHRRLRVDSMMPCGADRNACPWVI